MLWKLGNRPAGGLKVSVNAYAFDVSGMGGSAIDEVSIRRMSEAG